MNYAFISAFIGLPSCRKIYYTLGHFIHSITFIKADTLIYMGKEREISLGFLPEGIF